MIEYFQKRIALDTQFLIDYWWIYVFIGLYALGYFLYYLFSKGKK